MEISQIPMLLLSLSSVINVIGPYSSVPHENVSIMYLYEKNNNKKGKIFSVNVSVYYSFLMCWEVLLYFITATQFWPFIVIYLYQI